MQANPSWENARTLYFGGGTPSLLGPEEINSLCARFRLAPEAEVTLEVNPLQLTPQFLSGLRHTPVNRLSIGVQSLNDAHLRLLDRRHRAAQIPDQVKLCRDNGFSNLSLDLIYGLPGQDEDALRADLEGFLRLEPDHLSSYLLTLDDDAPLARRIGEKAVAPQPEDSLQAEQYHLIRQTLLQAGFEHYEISNFARPGMASRHNLAYWRSEPWLGLGASAAGYLPPLRYTNPADLGIYQQNVDSGVVFPEAETPGPAQQKADYLMMGLRLLEGVDLADYAARFGTDLQSEKEAAIAKLLPLGMLELTETHLRLSPEALFVSTAVIGELL